MRDRTQRAFCLALALVATSACRSEEDGNEPNPAEASIEATVVTPMCQEGFCTGDVDPHPTAPGYWFANSVTPETCFGFGHTDGDQDDLSDFLREEPCKRIRSAAALLPNDEIGREPRWVARRLAEEGVRIGYLLSYYRDAGSNSLGCSLPFHPPSCDGHNGDSEAIFLDLFYNWSTEHWVLGAARYSQHGNLKVYDGDGCTSTSYGCVYLQYPDRPQGYPRAWVSEGKHANYADLEDCNHGGFGASDTCNQVNAFVRVASGASLNLGSRAHHTTGQDCVISGNPAYLYYGSGGPSAIGR